MNSENQGVSDASIERELQAKGLTAPSIDIDAAVTRFLSWRLPDDFAPDCYIWFDKISALNAGTMPTGTNLLHAGQARAMLEHVLFATSSNVDSSIPAYQQRVIDEKRNLDENIKKLNEFLSTPLSLFGYLPAEEQTSMSSQLSAMTAYSVALGDRIARFGGAA